MTALSLSLSADPLGKRMQDRLRGLNQAIGDGVLWQQGSSRVRLHLDSFQSRLLPGWLICNLDLEADETGRQTLQFIFFLGRRGDGDGLNAGVAINTVNPQALKLAEAWGAAVQRVLWDGVLDAVEAALARAAVQKPGASLTLLGFRATDDAFETDIQVGAS
jgi:hypothetical protein